MAAVTLRAMEPSDIDMMYALESDTELWTWSSTTSPYSRHALQQFIDTCTNDIYADRQLRLVVCADGEATGCIDLFGFDPSNRRAEVGIALLPEFHGRGIGREALHQLAQFAVQHLQMVQLYAVVAASNHKAEQMFLSAGYKKAATLGKWVAVGGAMQDASLFQYFL